MSATRRGFLQSLFAGAILTGSGISVPAHSIQVYHAHEHYTAPGKRNIWYVHNGFWYLLSDVGQAPFEFASREAAESYIDKSGLQKYSDLNGKTAREGDVRVYRGPTEIYPMENLRRSEEEIKARL